MFEVHIEENNHYADEKERYKSSEFVDFDEALNPCKSIVEDFLTTNYKTGMTAGELYKLYMLFGEDAFIVGKSLPEDFSAWKYAEKRCREIAWMK